MPSFNLFTTFTSEVKQMWHMHKYVTLLDKIYLSQHIEIHKADYCLKYFKLVSILNFEFLNIDKQPSMQ